MVRLKTDTAAAVIAAAALMLGAAALYASGELAKSLHPDPYGYSCGYDVTGNCDGTVYSGSASSSFVRESEAYRNYRIDISLHGTDGTEKTLSLMFVFDGGDRPEMLEYSGTVTVSGTEHPVYSGIVNGALCTIVTGERCRIVSFDYDDGPMELHGELSGGS